MKRYLKLLMLILTASFFVLACQDTSNSSNGTNSGIEDGGSGGNGDGGGSSLDSEIINATMRVSADENDALKNTFFSPAVATNGGKLQYTWNFGDDTESIDTDYNYVTHQFNKYGKTYTIKLLLNNMSSSQQETVTMDLSLPKPELSINCNTSGALLFCNPVISQQAIQDVSYTWNIFDSTGKLEKEILSTGPSIINHRVANSGTYRIVLKGTSAQVDGEMAAERDIYVSVNISQGQITYNNTSSDMLSYKYTFNAQAIDGSQLEYCWDFDGTAKCSEGVGFQLGAQHSVADHTYSKYNAANTVTAFARIPGTNEVVSNSVIVQQALPEVSIKSEGTGLVRKLSPVFSFKPKGNISYIWKTGDGKEYSQETVNHTYNKNGTYTAELTVLNDLFAPEIGAVSAKPLNIYAYDNIQNVVIEHNRVSQSIEGETYTFSSPATSDTGKLYFTWKVNNAVVAEGEGLSSFTHTFTKYGQNASVGLDVKVINSSEIVSAEPVLVQTSKPTAVLNPPANVTVDIPAEFKGEVLSHLNGTDFTSNLVNPQYKLEISDVEYKYSDTLTIPYTFITCGAYTAKLVVTADNVEGSIISEPVTVQANEVLIACRNEANPADIYSVKVICQAENILDKTLKYSLTYQEYINDVYTTMEYGVEDTAEIILYHREKDGIYNNDTRNIIVNWEIYKDAASSENLGTYQYKNVVKEPAMGQVVDVLMKSEEIEGYDYEVVLYYDVSKETFIEETFNIGYKKARGVQSTYALDSNGRVYSWGNIAGGQYNVRYPQMTPKLVNPINGKVVKMWNDLGLDVFQTEDGEIYIAYNKQEYHRETNYTIRTAYFYHLKGMKGKKIKFIPENLNDAYRNHRLYFITNDNELYSIAFNIHNGINLNSGIITPEKVELSGKIKKLLLKDKFYIITDTNALYVLFKSYSQEIGELIKLADDAVDFGKPVNNETVSIKRSDGKLYNIPIGRYLTLSIYDGEILYNSGHNFIKGKDKKLYHNYPSDYIDHVVKCMSGLGANLEEEEYRKVLPINIPEEIRDMYEGGGENNNAFNAVSVSGKVYSWYRQYGECIPTLVSGFIIDSKIKQRTEKYLLLENGKIICIDNDKYINIPGNPFIVEIRKIDDHWNSNISYDEIYAVSDTGDIYMIDGYSIIKKIENLEIKNIKQIIRRRNNDGNDIIMFLINSGEVFEVIDEYSLDTYKAEKIPGLPNNIKYIHLNGGSYLAHTADNKIYGWGSNGGSLPVGDTAPRETPVLLDIPAYKKHLGPERTGLTTFSSEVDGLLRPFYTIFTDNGDIYSWGAVESTGTKTQENITMDGYVTKPTKVN